MKLITNTNTFKLALARHTLVVSLTVLLSVAAHASTTSPTDGETPLGLTPGAPGGSYALSGFDNINLYNGNLNFSLPLMQIGGRGGAQMTMHLTPIELKWRVLQFFIQPPQDPPSISYLLLPGVWNPIQPGYGPGVLIGRRAGTEHDCGVMNSPQIRYTLTRLTFVAPDGTEYELRDQLNQGKPADLGTGVCLGGQFSNFGRGRVFVTADGAAMTFVSDTLIEDRAVYSEFYFPTGYLFLRDGTRFRVEEGLIKSLTDRNGNMLTFAYDQYGQVTTITDSLNRTVSITYTQTFTGFDQITWKGAGGVPRTIKVWHGSLLNNFRGGSAEGSSPYVGRPLGDLFPQIPGYAGTSGDPFDCNVITAVEMPDGRQYRLFYNSYAELARVELPTGGAYEYDRTPTSGVLVPTTSDGGFHVYRRVVERRVYADGFTLEKKTNYANSDFGDDTLVDVQHHDRNGGLLAHEKHYFTGSAARSFELKAVCYPSYLEGKEYTTESYALDGSLLRKLDQSYAQRAGVPWWNTWQGPRGEGEPPNDTRLTDVTTTLADVSPNQVALQTFGYDQFNNRTDTWEFAFGTNGLPGPALRHSRTTYVVVNPVNNLDYTGFDIGTPTNSIHLRSLPKDQFVYAINQSTGADIQPAAAQTTFEYDRYDSTANHAALMNRSSISGLDAGFGTGRLARGNSTEIKRWLDTTGTWITIDQQYDIAGNVVKVIDPRSTVNNVIATTFDFSDRFGSPDDEARSNTQAPLELGALNTYAFPSLVTNALGQTSYAQFDYYLGKPVNGEDANGIVSRARYEDALDRPTGVDVGIFSGSQLQRHTSFIYSDSSHLITTQSDQTTLNDGVLTITILYDGLGRTIETRTSAPEGTIYTTQQYDAMGRVKRSYNPYRTTSDSTYGYTDTTYDALDRVKSVTTSDNAVVTTTYSGSATTATDQTGKKRRSVADGLGRLIRVDEPDAAGNLDNAAVPPQPLQPTSYVYDVLDDLVKVTQGTQNRYFAYDSLRRLIRARNPEQDINTNLTPAITDPVTGNSQWCMKYVYDANSNLTSKTDARNITTNYNYDALNRVTTRGYLGDPQNTPAVSFYYDSQSVPALPAGAPSFSRGSSTGRLVAVIYGGGNTGTYTGYDQVGRVVQSIQVTETQASGPPAPQAYGMTYSYNRAGGMLTESYPSGRVVATEYDSAGRIAGVRNQGSPNYYAGAGASDATNRIQYAAHGAITAMKLGNGKWEHTSFNNRLQPALIGLGTSSTDSSILKLDYDYGTSANNGNVVSQKITAPGLTINQCYGYDSLNRLLTAEERSGGTVCSGTQQWKQSFSYDRYGNRTFDVSNTTSNVLSLGSNPTISQATNRFSSGQGYGYDTAGNLTSDPATSANGVVYDAENRQTQYTKTGQQTNYYFYDGDGHRVKKVDNNGTTVFVYNAGGQLIVEYTSGPPQGSGTSYLTSDHLGSTRVVMKPDGSVARHDYLPFGEEIQSGIGGRTSGLGYVADTVRQKFTQKERDNESGLDYFLARYYASAQGRFTSADAPFADQNEGDAQSWNLFTYARNNPLLYTDPLGLWKQVGSGVWEWEKDDTWQGLAEILHVKRKDLRRAFKGAELGAGLVVDTNNLSAGAPENIYSDTQITPLARGVFTELDRRANASIKLIDYASMVTLGPIQLISGTGLFRAGLYTLARGAAEASAIRVTERGLAHVLARHVAGRAAKFAGKSIFNGGEAEVVSFIREAGSVARVAQPNGNFARVVDAGRIIGVDRVTGAPTSVYTVITDAAEGLVTAFPGRP